MATSSSSPSDVNSCSDSPSQTLENYICQQFCELDNEEGREVIRRQMKKSKARWKKYCKRKSWPYPEVHYKPVNPGLNDVYVSCMYVFVRGTLFEGELI